MKLAITGASGFIGRHVLEAIVRRNERRKEPFQIIATFKSRGDQLLELPSVKWKHFDLANEPRHAFEHLEEPTVLLHLAWAGLPNYQSDHHIKVELPRHIDFLQAIIENDIKGISVAGTCYEYGLQNGSLAENLPVVPSNPYGKAKDSLRRHLECLLEKKATGFTWFRIFYLYGSGQPARTLYAQLLKAISENKKTFDMSGGEQIRDYLSVEKASGFIADGVTKLIETGTGDGILNIGSGRARTVRSIVEEWISNYKSAIQPNFGVLPYSTLEPMEFWADTTKLCKISASTTLTD
jgi:nucleoside-diphosphate-sugar epimerase